MKTFSKGQKFLRRVPHRGNELYVLALVGIDRSSSLPYPNGDAIMKLICLRTGDRWSKGVAVKNCMKVTEDEMKALYSTGEFTPVEIGEISVQALVTENKSINVRL